MKTISLAYEYLFQVEIKHNFRQLLYNAHKNAVRQTVMGWSYPITKFRKAKTKLNLEISNVFNGYQFLASSIIYVSVNYRNHVPWNLPAYRWQSWYVTKFIMCNEQIKNLIKAYQRLLNGRVPNWIQDWNEILDYIQHATDLVISLTMLHRRHGKHDIL